MTHDKAAEFEKVTFFGCNIYGNITYSSFGVELNKKVLNSLNFQALLWGKKMKAMSGSGPGYMQSDHHPLHAYTHIPCPGNVKEAWKSEILQWSR